MFCSDLQPSERKEVAVSYLDYIQENALLVSQIKAVETKLSDNGIQVDLPDGSNLVALGKRQRVD